MEKETLDEIQMLKEPIEACIQEEGYEIPRFKYRDDGYMGFDVVLRNGVKTLVRISWP